MTILHCIKLDKDLESLERAPYPGELGKRILENVSKEAWQMWLDHQTMLINENNLNLFETSSQSYLKEQMEKYFFSADDLDSIQGYTPVPLGYVSPAHCSSTLKPSGNCLPVHQGLRVINSVLDPRSLDTIIGFYNHPRTRAQA